MKRSEGEGRNKMNGKEIILLSFFTLVLVGCLGSPWTFERCESSPTKYGQRDICFRMLAKETGNVSYCAYISDEILRDYWCYREIAYDKNKIEYCDLIEDEDARQSCYNVIEGKEKLERGV